jgi:hypothetical protein
VGDERVEFGIVYDRYPDELYRGPMTGDEAREWIEKVEADGFRPGAFVMVSRVIGPWEPCRMGVTQEAPKRGPYWCRHCDAYRDSLPVP